MVSTKGAKSFEVNIHVVHGLGRCNVRCGSMFNRPNPMTVMHYNNIFINLRDAVKIIDEKSTKDEVFDAKLREFVNIVISVDGSRQ